MWAQNDAMQIPGRDWVGGRGGYGGPQAPPMQTMPMPGNLGPYTGPPLPAGYNDRPMGNGWNTPYTGIGSGAMRMPAQAPPMPSPMQAMPSAPTQSGPMPQPNIGEILQRMFNKPALMDQPLGRDMEFRPWDPNRPEFDPNYKMPDFKSVMFPGAEIGPSRMAGDEYKNSQVQSEMIENLKKQYKEKQGARGGGGNRPIGMTGWYGPGGQGNPIYGGGYGGMFPGGWGGMTGRNPQARNVLGGWRQQMNRSDIGSPNEGMGSPLFAQIMALKAAQGGR